MVVIWPDWQSLQTQIPPSNLIKRYKDKLSQDSSLPPLRWQVVDGTLLPKQVRDIFIIAEDRRFYWHSGVDWRAIGDAMVYNFREGRVAVGASTISQQTVKNMFLSLSRTPLRKWHEIVLTLAMEANLKKNRIMTIYLNIVEFGKGIYGIQSAAQHYWGLSPSQLNVNQIAELAATLPSPKKHNPRTRTPVFLARTERIIKVWHHMNPEQPPQGSPSDDVPLPPSPLTDSVDDLNVINDIQTNESQMSKENLLESGDLNLEYDDREDDEFRE